MATEWILYKLSEVSFESHSCLKTGGYDVNTLKQQFSNLWPLDFLRNNWVAAIPRVHQPMWPIEGQKVLLTRPASYFAQWTLCWPLSTRNWSHEIWHYFCCCANGVNVLWKKDLHGRDYPKAFSCLRQKKNTVAISVQRTWTKNSHNRILFKGTFKWQDDILHHSQNQQTSSEGLGRKCHIAHTALFSRIEKS